MSISLKVKEYASEWWSEQGYGGAVPILPRSSLESFGEFVLRRFIADSAAEITPKHGEEESEIAKEYRK